MAALTCVEAFFLDGIVKGYRLRRPAGAKGGSTRGHRSLPLQVDIKIGCNAGGVSKIGEQAGGEGGRMMDRERGRRGTTGGVEDQSVAVLGAAGREMVVELSSKCEVRCSNEVQKFRSRVSCSCSGSGRGRGGFVGRRRPGLCGCSSWK